MESAIDSINLGEWQNVRQYEVTQTELSLQDLAVNLDEITELQHSSVFSLDNRSNIKETEQNDLI